MYYKKAKDKTQMKSSFMWSFFCLRNLEEICIQTDFFEMQLGVNR